MHQFSISTGNFLASYNIAPAFHYYAGILDDV